MRYRLSVTIGQTFGMPTTMMGDLSATAPFMATKQMMCGLEQSPTSFCRLSHT
jgi:hypothetical protein